MSRSLKSSGLAALAFSVSLGLLGLTAAPALAQTDDVRVVAQVDEPVLSKAVRIADLDLADAGDVRRLDFRIRAASRFVCAPFSNGQVTRAELSCRRTAVRSTDTRVAELRQQASRLAAANLPSRFDATVAVTAQSAE